MKKLVISLLAVGIAIAFPRAGVASPIVVQTNFDGLFATGFGGSFPHTVALASWTQSDTFTNVAISAFLAGNTQDYEGTAYLMTQIGPGTTAANEVVSPATFSTPLPLFEFQDVTLFSGLTIGPGTYYLVLAAPQDLSNPPAMISWGGSAAAASTFTRAPGVTGGAGFFVAFGPSSYAPAQDFDQFTDHDFRFSVTGDIATPVPEPSTLLLLVTGLIGTRSIARRRQRR